MKYMSTGNYFMENIQSLALKAIQSSNSQIISIYILTRLSHDSTIDTGFSRMLGKKSVVTTWPMDGDKKMRHVLTLDLNQIPKVKFDFLSGARTVSLFIDSLISNEAFELDVDATAIISTQENEIKALDTSDLKGSFPIAMTCLEVPASVFDDDIYKREEDDPLFKLHRELFNCSYVGGKPIWYQGEERSSDDFICQFDERFMEEINLGGDGVMYVFSEIAFWQCG
jgi:hypothetical protein